MIEAANVNIHAVLLRVASGQLPFLGLIRLYSNTPPHGAAG